ncbi:MAG: glycosyltransferase [Planctomycetota bacterium]
MDEHNIGFVSTRFAGTDGVSLEAQKWADVYREFGCEVFWYGGLLDRNPTQSMLVDEAWFGHPENVWINDQIWNQHRRSPEVTQRILDFSLRIKRSLYEFVDRFAIDTLVIENALCIPMHVPLGIAITNYISETNIPAVGHHHDFFWERDRFKRNAISDFLSMAFPPVLPSMQHVVINSLARLDLAARRGVPSTVVPNVHDFETPPPKRDDYIADMKADLGFHPDDIIILQPTRVIPRKGIPHSINLVEMLDLPQAKLVVSHKTGDEGMEYKEFLQTIARRRGVDMVFIDDHIDEVRRTDADGRKIYALGDAYSIADFVTYPSLYEGFGNALLETIYFKVPFLINRYNTYVEDIEPLGLQAVVIDQFVTDEAVQLTRRAIQDKSFAREMAEHNYMVAQEYFSYKPLRIKLKYLLDTQLRI